jgi:hypothetical protein
MIYLDLLDSVKTAHPQRYSGEWWRPNNDDERQAAIEMARADMMVRLLHGETIILSNNQATDSAGWLQLAHDFCRIELPWEPVSIAFFNVAPKSPADAVRKIVVDYFKDEKFNLSAWVGLSKSTREKVAKNVSNEERPQFGDMFMGVLTDIPDSYLDENLLKQAAGLQIFYEYLLKNQDKKVAYVADTVGEFIWPRMNALANTNLGISGEILDAVKKTAGESRLEFRSSLYNAASQFSGDQQQLLRRTIDYYYNQKMGLSVNRGRGVYTFSDFDENTPIDKDETLDRVVDSVNRPDGVISKVVLRMSPDRVKNYLTWGDFTDLLKDGKFLDKALRLRGLIQEYNTIDKRRSDYLTKYRTWLGKTVDAMQAHHEFLASYLSTKVVLKKKQMFFHIAPWAGAAIGAMAASSIFHGMELVGAGAGTLLSTALYDLIKDRFVGKYFEYTSVGRIRTILDEDIKIAPDEELIP